MAADRDQDNGTGEPGQREICSFQIGTGAGQQCTQAAYLYGLCDRHYYRGYQMDDDEKEDSVLRNVPRNAPAPAGPMPVLFSASPTKMTAAAPPEKKVAAVIKKNAPAPAGQAKKGKVCKITGCSKYPVVKGHCLSHALQHVEKEDMDNFKGSTEKICKIAGCWKFSVVKPYCRSHAREHVEKEDMDNHMERARARARPACKIAGCSSKRAVVKGYCLSHSHDHVGKEVVDNYKERTSARRVCKIADCSKYTVIKGYCLSHAREHVEKEVVDNFKETQRARRQKAYIEEKKKKKKGGR